jgi:hypothetical protein
MVNHEEDKHIKRKLGSFSDLNFTIDLSNYNKDISDIEDIIFCVKRKKAEPDANLLIKRMSLSEITLNGNVASVRWGHDEYDGFTVRGRYLAGLFLKFVGDPAFDENVDSIFTLIIEPDFLRDS